MRYGEAMTKLWLTALIGVLASSAHAASYTSTTTAAPYPAAPTSPAQTQPVAPMPAYPMTGPEIFAGQIGPQQLIDMLKQNVEMNALYKAIVSRHPKRTVEARLDRDARFVAAKNQAVWNDNLAQSYEGLLEPEEWVEIVNKTPSAKVKRKFPNVMMTAGARMKQRAEPLLQAMSTEVLQRLGAAFPLTSR